jgi:hypothetical protein
MRKLQKEDLQAEETSFIEFKEEEEIDNKKNHNHHKTRNE